MSDLIGYLSCRNLDIDAHPGGRVLYSISPHVVKGKYHQFFICFPQTVEMSILADGKGDSIHQQN